MSMSWGGGEFSGETADDTQYFDQAGVAFVASSGDAGAPRRGRRLRPTFWCVGGTALTLGAGNVWSSEDGWSGSGGGPSAYESQPSYQKGVVTQTSTRREPPRTSPMTHRRQPASPFMTPIPYEGTTYGWVAVGGTSAGAPQWSALLAIADQGRASSGQPPLDSTSPQEVMNILYKNPADFHDITSGTSTGTPEYSAGPGYDYVTGLGSPMANLVVGSLDGTSTASYDKLVLAAPTAETAGTSFSLTVTAQNSSGATDTGYLGTIQFTSSDVQAGLPANFTFTAADDGTYTFTVTLKTAGSQSITATDNGDARHHRHALRDQRQPGRRQPVRPVRPSLDHDRGRVADRHGHRGGPLRQRGDRLHAAPSSSPAATHRPACRRTIAFHGRRSGAYPCLPGHVRDGRHAVGDGDRHRLGHHRHSVGNHRAAGGRPDVDGRWTFP